MFKLIGAANMLPGSQSPSRFASYANSLQHYTLQ
jgi:hypothetical protein